MIRIGLMHSAPDANSRRFATHSPFCFLAKEDNLGPALKSRISWFWLAGRGLDKEGIFKTNPRGTLIRIWGLLAGVVIVRAT